MHARMNMVISNGNLLPPQIPKSTASVTSTAAPSSSLNSSIIQRIHNVRPGCGSCGRK
jgi:hypothetical protein